MAPDASAEGFGGIPPIALGGGRASANALAMIRYGGPAWKFLRGRCCAPVCARIVGCLLLAFAGCADGEEDAIKNDTGPVIGAGAGGIIGNTAGTGGTRSANVSGSGGSSTAGAAAAGRGGRSAGDSGRGGSQAGSAGGTAQAGGGGGGAGSSAGSGGQTGTAGNSSAGASGGGGTGSGDPNAPTVGVGSIDQPARGPAPIRAAEVGGAPFVLVKNWDFGAAGTIRNIDDLIAEFEFHDQFGTIANGTNYGAVTVAPTAATAITANNLGLPGNRQPVEDPARPYREFTDAALKAYVRPLSASATNVSVSAHDTGNGSFMAKWELPNGGALLGKNMLWEARARIAKPAKAYWYALWTAGQQWNGGAEMDVVESFGTPNIQIAKAFHVNSVGGRDQYSYSSWPSTLDTIGVPAAARDQAEFHVWTWVYLKDDTFKVYYDGYVVQSGSIHWTLGGTQGGQAIDMEFLYDFGWGHTQISDVNITLPASAFPIEYEIDYSRVYLR